MKKKVKLSALILAIIMTFCVLEIFAQSIAEIYGFSEKVNEGKIDAELRSVMAEKSYDDNIPVWIWFADIDKQEIDEQVKEDTGLSIDSLAMPFEPVPDELKKASTEAFEVTDNDPQHNSINAALENYVGSTDTQRTEERQRTNTYIRARRETAQDVYQVKNQTLIEELNLPTEKIIFQSQLTPSVIVNLTKEQILDVERSADVVSIYLYDDTEYEPPSAPAYTNQRTAMRVDMAQEYTGVTGNGVNVLMTDHGVVRWDDACYDAVQYPEKIKSVVNKKLYDVTDTSVFSGGSGAYHPNIMAGVLQDYASDVNIFSTGYGEFADLEWVLINFDIHLINCSANYGYPSNYSTFVCSKWFDAIVSTYNVTLIASVGNENPPFIRVISPAMSYNSIAISAYNTDGNPNNDTMFDYRYSPITGADLVNYKPDMVVAASTGSSGAAPTLSGIASMMIQLKPSLAATPELIKAILMASCHRKVLPFAGTPQENIADGLTQRQGSGAVDAFRAISIVVLGNYGVETITSGSTDINIGQPADSPANVNVSLAWLRKNTYTQGNTSDSTLGTLQELELSIFSNSQLVGTSDKTNAGKQMVYFPSSSFDHMLRVTKTTQNTELVRYAYAWSAENSDFNLTYDLSASVTDLTYSNETFNYNNVRFSDSHRWYNNRPLYVVLKKCNNSDIVFTSPTYTVITDAFAVGQLDLSVISDEAKSFTADEHIEILMYSDSVTQNLISRQFINPVLFTFK